MNSNPSTTSTTLSSSSVSAEAISRRAYEIWEQEGRPDGCDLQHWLRAEQELSGRSIPGTARTPTAEAPRTDAKPLQGTRASGAANRENKRATPTPFGEKTPGNGRQPSMSRK